MSAPEFHLTLPTRGSLEHLAQIGRAADVAGFHGALVPYDPAGEESLVLTAGVLRANPWLRGAAGIHPAIATPVYAAKVSASLQRFSGDRLDWHLTVDLEPAVARAQGDFVEGDDRYVRADEFLTVAQGVWYSEDYTFEGRFFDVLAGGFQGPLSGRAFPRVYLSGTSPEALELSAKHADVHLFGVEDAEGGLESLVGELAERAAAYGRAPSAGLRLPVLAREDAEEARTEAGRRGVTVPAGLLGSYGQVADTLRGHAAAGASVFVLETEPGVAEPYLLGEHLLPLFIEESAHVD